MPKPKKPVVHVVVLGGSVDVELSECHVPIKVVVTDYDYDGVEASRITKDEDGDPCIVTTFEK